MSDSYVDRSSLAKHNVDVHIPKTDNLTQAERSALRNIQERDDIIIKPADKGSTVVVMDKTMNGHRSDLTKKMLLPVSQTLCRRDTHWMTLSDPKFISLTTIQVGKRIKDIKERVFGSANYKHFILFKYILTLISKQYEKNEKM
jgi:hypothetical protein